MCSLMNYKNICYYYFSVSLYSLVIYGTLYWVFKNIPVRNRGGQMGKSIFFNGRGRSKRTFATIEDGV